MIDSSGSILAFSRSTAIFSARSDNAFRSMLSVAALRSISGTNSKAPIPRLPMKASFSSEVTLFCEILFSFLHCSKRRLPQASGKESAINDGNFWYIRSVSPKIARVLNGLCMEAVKGATSKFPRRNSGLYVKYDKCRLSCQAKRPISLSQRNILSTSFIICNVVLVAFFYCFLYTGKVIRVVLASAHQGR